MLHLIGLILKIIGIIVAVILGLLVLLICVMLFVPVRYEVQGQLPGKMSDAAASLKISWLLHLISVQARYGEGKMKWKARAAWIKFGSENDAAAGKEEPGEEKLEKELDDGKEGLDEKLGDSGDKIEENSGEDKIIGDESSDEMVETTADKGDIFEEIDKTFDAQKEQSGQRKEAISDQSDPHSREPENSGAENDSEQVKGKKIGQKKKRKPIRLILHSLAEKIKNIFKKIKYTFCKICDKLKIASKKKEQLVAFLENETHKNAFARLKKELVWLKRFLKPKKLRANLRFGFEDPYHTGQALAVFSMIYPFTGNYISVTPDFECRVLEGNLYIKGKLRMIHLAMLALRVLLDRNVRKTYRDVRRVLNR